MSVVAVFGSTGVGKSKLAVEIGKALKNARGESIGEIINMDSMQIYKGFPIATNIPTKEEMTEIPHHLFGFLEPTVVDYTATNYVKDAATVIDDIHSRGKIPILVGGTHYYLYSLLWESSIQQMESTECKTLSELHNKASEELWVLLRELDPRMSEKLHPNDRRKVIKYVEEFYKTGRPASDRLVHSEKRLRWDCCFIWIDSDLEQLGPRLDDRVDKMVERGLLDELRALVTHFCEQSKNICFTKGIFQSIGGKEFESYIKLLFPLQELDKEYCLRSDVTIDSLQAIVENNINSSANLQQTIENGIEQLKLRTRQYARKQKPWIRNKLLPRTNIFHVDASDISNWKEDIFLPTLKICEAFLAGNLPQKHPWLLSQDLGCKSEQLKAWKKFHCALCNKTYNGPNEWNVHQTSKQHLNTKRKLRKKAILHERLHAD